MVEILLLLPSHTVSLWRPLGRGDAVSCFPLPERGIVCQSLPRLPDLVSQEQSAACSEKILSAPGYTASSWGTDGTILQENGHRWAEANETIQIYLSDEKWSPELASAVPEVAGAGADVKMSCWDDKIKRHLALDGTSPLQQACMTLASCLAEISTFLRFSYESWKLGKTGWCWQKREKSAVGVPFQGLSTNWVLLIFFGLLPVATATSLSPVTRRSAIHSLLVGVWATAFMIWLFQFLLLSNPWKSSSE